MPRREAAVGLTLLVLAASLRFPSLGSNSLWIDEIATARIVAHPFADILSATAELNFCPPLFFWLVHGVVAIGGHSEITLRLVSALAGSLTVPLTWQLVRELTGRRSVAWLAGLLLALNPLHIWYSQEGRPYALMLAFGVAALRSAVGGLRGGGAASWAAFAGWSVLSGLTHTLGLVFVAVGWSWVLLSSARRRALVPAGLASVAVAVAYLPFALVISRAVAAAAGNLHSPPRPLVGLELPYTLLTFVGGYSFGPAVRDLQNLGTAAAIRLHWIETAAAVLLILLLAIQIVRRPWPGRRELAALCLLPVVATLLAAAGSGKAYEVRYVLPGLLGFCGLVAGAAGQARPGVRRAAVVGVVTVSLIADLQWYLSPDYQKDDARAAVGILAARLPPNAVVAVAPSYVTAVLSYYAAAAHAPLGFVMASPRDTVSPVLVLSRLHHVSDVADLRRAFARGRQPARESRVGGFYFFWRRPQSPASFSPR